MRIGLDFDGVVSDCGQLKSQGAKSLYGVDIPPEIFKREIVVGKGLLTLEQYRNLQKQIYGTRQIGLTMLPVEGALEIIPRLQRDGHYLPVVTSRGNSESEIAREWMMLQGLELDLISVGPGVTKTDACRGLDVYIDDDLDKLEPLVDIVPNRFLFSWDYNRHVHLDGIAKRIGSWQQFYDEISTLNA